jgi:hypothetical protein
MQSRMASPSRNRFFRLRERRYVRSFIREFITAEQGINWQILQQDVNFGKSGRGGESTRLREPMHDLALVRCG